MSQKLPRATLKGITEFPLIIVAASCSTNLGRTKWNGMERSDMKRWERAGKLLMLLLLRFLWPVLQDV